MSITPNNADKAENNPTETNDSPDNEVINYFLNDENFERLRLLQESLSNTIGISIRVKKLANLLITDENIDKLKHQLLNQLKL